jgi:T6SS, Phospholipase effector Tle1-like, catalytic domain
MANIIVCCDGTWNTAGQRDQGLPCPTNVVKIYNALAQADKSGVTQKTYYHPGVGAEGDIFEHFLGGTIGDGRAAIFIVSPTTAGRPTATIAAACG